MAASTGLTNDGGMYGAFFFPVAADQMAGAMAALADAKPLNEATVRQAVDWDSLAWGPSGFTIAWRRPVKRHTAYTWRRRFIPPVSPLAMPAFHGGRRDILSVGRRGKAGGLPAASPSMAPPRVPRPARLHRPWQARRCSPRCDPPPVRAVLHRTVHGAVQSRAISDASLCWEIDQVRGSEAVCSAALSSGADPAACVWLAA